MGGAISAAGFGSTRLSQVIDEGAGLRTGGREVQTDLHLCAEAGISGEDWHKARIAFSADGLQWNWYAAVDTLFPGQGEDDENWAGILNSYYDPIQGQYGMFFRYYEPYTWENAEGVTQTDTIRRTGFTTSSDYIHWTAPK